MKKPVIVLIVALVALAALVAGCGSSSSNSTETTASISKAEFVKRGNAICATSEEQGDKELTEFLKEEGIEGEEPSEEVKEKLAEEIVLPNVSNQVEEVRALGFPAGSDGEEAEEVVVATEEAVEAGEEEPRSLFSGGGGFEEANKLAKEYGLTACAS